MARGLVLAFLLLAAGVRGDATAATRLFVSGPDGAGAFGSFGGSDGTFTLAPANGGLDVFFDSNVRFFQLRATFITADGQLPAPGTYDGVEDVSFHPNADGHPKLYYVVIEDAPCYDFSGSFVIHELVPRAPIVSGFPPA
jgi:hypothetical protein